MKTFSILITIAFTFHNTFSADEKYDQIPAETEEELIQARQNLLPIGEDPPIQSIYEINEKSNLSKYFYQGDILLTAPQAVRIAERTTPIRRKRQAFRDAYYPDTIWNNTVYYYFDDTTTVAMIKAFRAAAAFWENNTCLRFEENEKSPDRIRVFKGVGCWSYIGRIGGRQDLCLGDGCETAGIASHELGHALGFFHTQSRHDRDENIKVIIENIKPQYVDQFDKETKETNYNYDMPYDYGSIMQYGLKSASKNDEPTMLALDALYTEAMGSDIVAFYDISMINEHYGCKEKCKSSGTECHNGGFPNPNNCNICICPSGYGGTLCNERPPGCGETLIAGPSYSQMISVVGDGSKRKKLYFSQCAYWIEAPADKHVEVRFDNYRGYYGDGCIYGGVEIKSHPDQLRTGYRFCSPSNEGTVLVSPSNRLPVITFNRYYRSHITLSYRYVDEVPATDPATTQSADEKTAPPDITTPSPNIEDPSATTESINQETDVLPPNLTTPSPEIEDPSATTELINQETDVVPPDIATPSPIIEDPSATTESSEQGTDVAIIDTAPPSDPEDPPATMLPTEQATDVAPADVTTFPPNTEDPSAITEVDDQEEYVEPTENTRPEPFGVGNLMTSAKPIDSLMTTPLSPSAAELPTTTGPSVCIDLSPDCSILASHGYCRFPSIRMRCLKSCKVC
ncbi:unnamed protein product [Cylicocyclus nassatus]|uniref:Metalloendopeptidase n=1 Tax=Cylicocyclus nassatus TaxID=53992 RepID=A0AA36GK96_CYLNA|nr:unnamed protein product [Cylicocyclus nassatus]